ncbi:MAG: hypothetical protein WB622_18530 [Acidobacteriaceae bacterium]
MTHIYLYRYPFDATGSQILTFAESLAAMQELERQLNAMLKPDWRWCDLGLEIVERHPTYVIYEVMHHQEFIGRAVVMPYCADPPRKHPNAETGQSLYEKIRTRRNPEGA